MIFPVSFRDQEFCWISYADMILLFDTLPFIWRLVCRKCQIWPNSYDIWWNIADLIRFWYNKYESTHDFRHTSLDKSLSGIQIKTYSTIYVHSSLIHKKCLKLMQETSKRIKICIFVNRFHLLSRKLMIQQRNTLKKLTLGTLENSKPF